VGGGGVVEEGGPVEVGGDGGVGLVIWSVEPEDAGTVIVLDTIDGVFAVVDEVEGCVLETPMVQAGDGNFAQLQQQCSMAELGRHGRSLSRFKRRDNEAA